VALHIQEQTYSGQPATLQNEDNGRHMQDDVISDYHQTVHIIADKEFFLVVATPFSARI
jgi:hypothetical protein